MGNLKLICAVLALTLGFSSASQAQDNMRRVVEDVPQLKNLYRVSATKTPSGFPVPRYVTLKVGEAVSYTHLTLPTKA